MTHGTAPLRNTSRRRRVHRVSCRCISRFRYRLHLDLLGVSQVAHLFHFGLNISLTRRDVIRPNETLKENQPKLNKW